MKRLMALGSLALVAAVYGLTGPVGAEDGPAPHNDEGMHNAHPHHTHTGDGECRNLQGPDFERSAHAGRHWGAVKGGEVHHGTCAAPLAHSH